MLHKILIGIDGGATKAAAAIVASDDHGFFDVKDNVIQMRYEDCPSYSSDFLPVKIDQQLVEEKQHTIHLSIQEERQGLAYIEAVEKILLELLKKSDDSPVCIGIGMPGIKTANKHGITVMNSGPRIPRFLDLLEYRLKLLNIDHYTLNGLGEDSYFCGLGEKHHRYGNFSNVNFALFIGGGTGIADAIVLEGVLTPFEQINTWFPKTWQMINPDGISFETLISHSGIMKLYSQKTGITMKELDHSRIYPDRILKENNECRMTFIHGLSTLIVLRAESLFQQYYCGFEKIVCALRLGTMLEQDPDLFHAVKDMLSGAIKNSVKLSDTMKQWYLERDFLVISKLKNSPIIGAGVFAANAF